MLLSVRQLSKTFGTHAVLDNITFSIERGERVGIVGANGAGKSTLLRILAGQEAADSGSVTLAPSVELGYLPQSTPDFAGHTLDDLIRESVGSLRQLEARMREIEAAMISANEETLAPLLDEYGQVSTRFQDRGGYELDHHIEAVLVGLRLDYLPRDRDIWTLSGGERARVQMATLLLRSPDLLLLDEPTNHLDIATLEWLEHYVAHYAGAVTIISHDRQFLNRAVNRIFAIDDRTHQLQRYDGDYDAYIQAKDAERVSWEERYRRQQEEIRELRRRMRETGRNVAHNRQPTDNDKTAYNFFGERVAQQVSRNVRDAAERLARIEADPVEKPPKPLRFAPRFNAARVQARAVIVAEGIGKSFDGRAVLRDVSFSVAPDARILLAGPNGAGKTTLLRILLGLEQPDTGTLRVTPGAQVAYLPQDPVVVDANRTLLETYREGLTAPEGTIVASILGNGLFHLDDLPKHVGWLSLGQRRKLEIARLVADHPNVLLLDEPTNYISLDVLEAFEAAVLGFPGPVIAVSHDRYFMRRFGGEVWRLDGGSLSVEAASAQEEINV